MTSLSEALTRHERWWPDEFDDREIEAVIWPEIVASTSRGDFACYLVHRLLKARHLEEARARYDRMTEADPEPLHYFQAINKLRALAEQGHGGAMFHMGKVCRRPRTGTAARRRWAICALTAIWAGCISRAWA